MDELENLFTGDEMNEILSDSATEVGFNALEQLMDYYAEMLVYTIGKVAELTGSSRAEVRMKFEEELGLVGKMEDAYKRLNASTETIKTVLGSLGYLG